MIDVVRAARWLTYKFHLISQEIYNCAGWRCAAKILDFLDPDHDLSSRRLELSGMLEIPQRFQKTEHKDSIYGILGLFDGIESESEHGATLLHVDYTRPSSETRLVMHYTRQRI